MLRGPTWETGDLRWQPASVRGGFKQKLSFPGRCPKSKYGKAAGPAHRKEYHELEGESQREAASFSGLCGKAEALGSAHNN